MKISSLVGHIVELAQLIEKNIQPTDRIVSEFLRARKYLGSSDRRFISQATYGLVRFRKKIETLLEQFVKEHPFASDILSSGAKFLAHYVAYAVAVEEASPEQIVSSLGSRWNTFFPNIDPPNGRVDLLQFTDWLVGNKSLDFLAGDDVQQLAGWYSFQEWMVREWLEQFGTDETESMLNALNEEAGVILRVNTLKTTIEECQTRLRTEGINTEQTKFSPMGLLSAKRFNSQASSAFKEGLFEVQDEGSQIVCLLAQPQPGSFVIDACAGTGGKTLIIADLMKNEGEILALDVEPKRLRELERRATRSGARIITAKPSSSIQGDIIAGRADLVLVDAPCSGIGTIRRNPALKWNVTESLVNHYTEIQSKILNEHAAFVKRGGKLVYATCSLFRKENEEIVQNFLALHPEFFPVVPTTILTQLGIESKENSPYVKLLPHKHRTDGFFVAVLEGKK